MSNKKKEEEFLSKFLVLKEKEMGEVAAKALSPSDNTESATGVVATSSQVTSCKAEKQVSLSFSITSIKC